MKRELQRWLRKTRAKKQLRQRVLLALDEVMKSGENPLEVKEPVALDFLPSTLIQELHVVNTGDQLSIHPLLKLLMDERLEFGGRLASAFVSKVYIHGEAIFTEGRRAEGWKWTDLLKPLNVLFSLDFTYILSISLSLGKAFTSPRWAPSPSRPPRKASGRRGRACISAAPGSPSWLSICPGQSPVGHSVYLMFTSCLPLFTSCLAHVLLRFAWFCFDLKGSMPPP